MNITKTKIKTFRFETHMKQEDIDDEINKFLARKKFVGLNVLTMDNHKGLGGVKNYILYVVQYAETTMNFGRQPYFGSDGLDEE